MKKNLTPSGVEHDRADEIEVGSFFLETLTTGMYESPFHCIREYMQNGYDAIEDARRANLLKGDEGEILISVTGTARVPTLTVWDDGIGIPAERAFRTLVSLGASRKTPARHAGFRGIGRLAGMAYCTTLRFTTKAAGSDVAIVVEFDCGRIRGFFTPGAEPEDVRKVVLASVRTFTVPKPEGEHFTEVQMLGLVNLGVDFIQMEKLQPYLQQVCPVDYVDNFDFADKVKSIAHSYGDPLRVVRVAARQKRERVPIHKAYRNSAATGKKNNPATLTEVEPCGSKERGWYGWIGISNFPGEIVDETVAGIRFRVKNIQIGDAGIIEDIAEGLTSGRTERRLQRWAVGEIFITNSQVVPNARRDGFEDSQAWRAIRDDIRDHVAARVVKLLRAASKSRSLLKEVASAAGNIERSVTSPAMLPAQKANIGRQIDQQLRRLSTPSKLTGADPREVSSLTSHFKDLQERLAAISAEEPPVDAPPIAAERGGLDDRMLSVIDSARTTDPEPRTILDVVREVLVEELDAAEAERLMQMILLRVDELP